MNVFTALLITGIVLVYLDRKLTCPPNKVEYRYLPRTMSHYMEDAAFSSQDVMKTMEDKSGNVWLERSKGLKYNFS